MIKTRWYNWRMIERNYSPTFIVKLESRKAHISLHKHIYPHHKLKHKTKQKQKTSNISMRYIIFITSFAQNKTPKQFVKWHKVEVHFAESGVFCLPIFSSFLFAQFLLLILHFNGFMLENIQISNYNKNKYLILK